jgi:diketogulonate reductase-like aldo/keto reductase
LPATGQRGALEEAYQAGKLRAIGLSNFEQADIENILEACRVKPMVNLATYHFEKGKKRTKIVCQT